MIRTGCRVAHHGPGGEPSDAGGRDRGRLSRVESGRTASPSGVARRPVRAGPSDPGRIGFALEKEMPPVTDPETARTVRVDFGAADWGYGWSFPKRGSTTVGVGGLQARNPDLKASLHRYAALLEQGEATGMKGHFLPFRRLTRTVRGGAMSCWPATRRVSPGPDQPARVIAHALASGGGWRPRPAGRGP